MYDIGDKQMPIHNDPAFDWACYLIQRARDLRQTC